MSTVRGYIREIRPRYLAKSQRAVMEANNVNAVYEEGSKRATATRDDLVKSLRSGDAVAVVHAFLLANPAMKRKRGGTRADFWKAVDEIEARGASIHELYTGLQSTDAKSRDIMTRAAVEALALGRHKTSGSDKRGRPGWKLTELERAAAQAIWESQRYKRWQDAVRALQRLDKRWSQARAYRELGNRTFKTEA